MTKERPTDAEKDGGERIVTYWRRCSNYIIIIDLTHDFNVLGKDNCKTRQKTLKF